MKFNHFLFVSLFALLSLSSHGFEHEHELHEGESEEHCIPCYLLEFSDETNKLELNFSFTKSIYFFSKKENLYYFKIQNSYVRAPPIG